MSRCAPSPSAPPPPAAALFRVHEMPSSALQQVSGPYQRDVFFFFFHLAPTVMMQREAQGLSSHQHTLAAFMAPPPPQGPLSTSPLGQYAACSRSGGSASAVLLPCSSEQHTKAGGMALPCAGGGGGQCQSSAGPSLRGRVPSWPPPSTFLGIAWLLQMAPHRPRRSPLSHRRALDRCRGPGPNWPQHFCLICRSTARTTLPWSIRHLGTRRGGLRLRRRNARRPRSRNPRPAIKRGQVRPRNDRGCAAVEHEPPLLLLTAVSSALRVGTWALSYSCGGVGFDSLQARKSTCSSSWAPR